MMRRLIVVLLSILAVLLVSFGVVMGFYVLTGTLADRPAAMALLWVGRGLAVMLVTVFVLLVLVLGLMAATRE